MRLIIEKGHPAWVKIVGLPAEGKLRDKVTALVKYRDARVSFEYRRWQKSSLLKNSLPPEEYQAKLKSLQARLVGFACDGDRVYAGLANQLSTILEVPVENEVEYPESELIPWDNKPKNKPRPYQEEAIEKLIEAKHGAIELATGLGKSTVLLYVAKRLGLPAIISCPSISIAGQLYADFLDAFGKKKVGFFGDGKKESGKFFVIAINDSLAQVVEGSKEWKELSRKQVFMADESHRMPADTLRRVCFGLCAAIPYRMFVSATQIRGDGLGVVLEGIAGDIVMKMSAREGIDQGFLARPHFKMIWVPGVRYDDGRIYSHPDMGKLQRAHIVNNKKLHQIAARVASGYFLQHKRPVLILIDEMPQFAHILPILQKAGRVGFAHSANSKESLEKIPKDFRKSDPKALVKALNKGDIDFLVGTSCVATGTDFTTVGHVIDLVGGASETALKQRVGRGTRLAEGKDSFYYTDFVIADVPDLVRHADVRREIYEELYEAAEESRVLFATKEWM